MRSGEKQILSIRQDSKAERPRAKQMRSFQLSDIDHDKLLYFHRLAVPSCQLLPVRKEL